jgi:diguanylate cyclase (GGDEF)-like protein
MDPMAQLIVVEGPNRGKNFEVERRVVIGNAEGVEVRLDDRRAGERQAEIRLADGGRFEIVNLDPKRNLLVNGEVTKRAKLSHGDWITVAESTLVFSEETPKRAGLELQSIDAGELFQSTVVSRRSLFDSAESVIDAFDRFELPSEPNVSIATQARRNRDRLAVLYRVSTAVSSQLHLPRLLDTILELVFEVFNADRGFVLLVDEDDRKLKPMASKVRGMTAEQAASATPDVSKTIIKEVFHRKEALLSQDAQQDGRFQAGMSIVGSSMRSLLCAPFVRNDHVLGIIQLDTVTTRHAFAKEDLDLLSAIAMQCAIAIENARAYKKRQEYARNLVYLGRATQKLSSYLDRDRIAKESVKSACSLLGCTKGSIILRRDEHHRLALVYAIGMAKELVARIPRDEVGRRFARKVIETGQPLLVAQMKDLPPEWVPEVHAEPGRYTSDSFLIVPILATGEDVEARGSVIGALCLTDKLSKVPWSGNDQELAQILASQAGIALANAELYEKATVDNLTKVFVRRYFMQRLETAIRNAGFTKDPLSLIMIDLDHFKAVNDTYGHQAGDAVLKGLGKTLKKVVRPDQTVARYGGEEFAILCPGVDRDVVSKVAERVRAAVEETPFKIPDGRELRKTCSLGCATLEPGEGRDQLIERADQALYDAKKTGRNRWVIAGPPGSPPLSGETAPKKAAKGHD